MKIIIENGMPFVSATVYANQKSFMIERALLDTGSTGTAFRTEDLESLGIYYTQDDDYILLKGFGGLEPIVEKAIDAVVVGDLTVGPMVVQMGALDYGYNIQGIIGLDFLLQAGAVLDFVEMDMGKGIA